MHVDHWFDRWQAQAAARRLMILQSGLQLIVTLISDLFNYFTNVLLDLWMQKTEVVVTVM